MLTTTAAGPDALTGWLLALAAALAAFGIGVWIGYLFGKGGDQ